ncbi:MAG TPA: PEP-CTERM sorting domain-containing protein [Verrucomicrobiae bacterium]|jgi:hypothetical protein
MIWKPGEAMKNTNNAFSVLSQTHSLPIVLIVALTLATTVVGVKAQTYNISVSDSTMQINLTDGLSGWTAGGVNQLANQWYYYSIGVGAENPINTISAPGTPTFSGLPLGGRIIDTNLTTTYANSALSLTTSYTLQVQGSGSTLNSAITLENLSGTNETFHFYQLSAFALGGTSGGQTVQFLQTISPYGLSQTGNGGTLTVTTSGLTGGTSDSAEEMAGIGNFGLGTGNPAPTFNDSSLSATGNVDFAYEFTATVAPGSGVTINELETVPEPSSLAVASAGLFVAGLLRRRALAFFKK